MKPLNEFNNISSNLSQLTSIYNLLAVIIPMKYEYKIANAVWVPLNLGSHGVVGSFNKFNNHLILLQILSLVSKVHHSKVT